MSCFRLPKDTCARLRSAMIEFWWSNGNNRKKIAWVAWEKLCKSKDKGGLGFKDLEMFNQSLLAKQAARVLNYPDSLIAQVLKHRYFRNSSFLESGLGSRPSFAWRSILHGRDLLQQGLIKNIGNGSTTVVWWDRWILDTIPRVPEYRQGSVIDLTLKVEDLFDQQVGGWDQIVVRETFSPKDAEIILKLRPNREVQDSIVWGLTKNGVYSSKSGYALLEAIAEMNSPTTPIPPIEKKLWMDLWKTKTSPKLHHFLWRTLSGALAVKERLRSRGILLDTTCSSCHDGPEDICHVLFHCRFAQEVWALSSVPMPPSGRWSSSVFLNLFHLMSCSRKSTLPFEAGQSFPWILWQIWKARNEFCFDHSRRDPAVILDKALVEAEIWRDLQDSPPVIPSASSGSSMSLERWSKPPQGWVKCNSASSWLNSVSNSGAGWLVRDSNGKAVFHSRRSFSPSVNSTLAELTALLWTVNDMVSLRVEKVILETSSISLRDTFLSISICPLVRSMVTEIFLCLSRIPCWRLEHIGNIGNRVASSIAFSATSVSRSQSYVATGGPAWLQGLLTHETALSGV